MFKLFAERGVYRLDTLFVAFWLCTCGLSAYVSSMASMNIKQTEKHASEGIVIIDDEVIKQNQISDRFSDMTVTDTDVAPVGFLEWEANTLHHILALTL